MSFSAQSGGGECSARFEVMRRRAGEVLQKPGTATERALDGYRTGNG